jgi:hypothetical protein
VGALGATGAGVTAGVTGGAAVVMTGAGGAEFAVIVGARGRVATFTGEELGWRRASSPGSAPTGATLGMPTATAATPGAGASARAAGERVSRPLRRIAAAAITTTITAKTASRARGPIRQPCLVVAEAKPPRPRPNSEPDPKFAFP